jgi:predicted Zn-dependent protease
MLDLLEPRLVAAMPAGVDYCSMRYFDQRIEGLGVLDDVAEPARTTRDVGVMITIWSNGGLGYAATSDLSPAGLGAAVALANNWAGVTAGLGVLAQAPLGHPVGDFRSTVERSWADIGLSDRIDLLRTQCEALAGDDRIVERAVGLGVIERDTLLVTNEGGRIHQHFDAAFPTMSVTANDGSNTQTRTFAAHSAYGQGGVEVLDRYGFLDAAPRLAHEAIALLDAPNCPSGVMDLLLGPDQMVLQIHESIGHPLELDRILGDERNYAGTSFVTPDMFGTFAYGSSLLNVTFDPTVDGEISSYAFDDDGTPATRQFLIREGILERPLGGAISQARSGLEGVANSRACSWNRPPMDRMANLNVEPGDSTFDELVASIEHGVFMQTNTSWSIDDSRNKFQFSCEHGTLIEDGELTTTVRNPSYRGISRDFWRNLAGVGDRDLFQAFGVPNCGKGEPNQTIWVGHATPPCHFRDVEVFGGAS